jgi:hypothetical protein
MTDNTDPVNIMPYIENAAQITIVCPIDGTTQIGTTVTLGSVTAKNRATPQLLQADLGVSGAISQFVQNTTIGKSSSAWVYKNIAGTVFSLSQPLTTPTLPNGAVSEVDTWANTDTVNLYAPVSVNIVSLTPHFTDVNAAANNYLWVKNCALYDPGATFRALMTTGTPVSLTETIIQRQIFANGWGVGVYSDRCVNCDVFGGIASLQSLNTNNGAVLDAGIWSCPTSNGRLSISSPSMRDDIIFDQSPLLEGAASSSASTGVYIASGQVLAIDGEINGGSSIWWGPGAFLIRGTGRLGYTGTAVAAFKQTGAWTINGAATGNSLCTSAGVGTWNMAITVNPTNIDAACGVAGFGGTVFGRGGAMIVNNF